MQIHTSMHLTYNKKEHMERKSILTEGSKVIKVASVKVHLCIVKQNYKITISISTDKKDNIS